MDTILIVIPALLSGVLLGYVAFKLVLGHRGKKAEEIMADAEAIKEKARKEAKQIIEVGDQKASTIQEKAEKEKARSLEKLDALEEKIIQKEEKLEQKYDALEKEQDELKIKKEEIQKSIDKQKEVLEKVAGLSEEEAKEKMFEMVEEENKKEIVRFIQKFKQLKKEEAAKVGGEIVSEILPRVSVDQVNEFTISSVDLPTEDIKGKIIGREGRNISYFERVTGVELVIDDTPLMVKISSYDPEKRYLAVETLKKLIKDGRINPVYIQKYYKEITDSMGDLLKTKGEEALSELSLSMMHPDIVKMIGEFHLRYSYGQNLLNHSIEVSKLSELIANELGFDGVLAKKAGLLHDIGKLSATSGQAHTKIGADLLRKYGFDKIIINAAESHHFDIEASNPLSWIVAAADAISAGRLGARFNTKEMFIERMTNMEKLITSVSGIDKVYIMQAGREIIVFVKPDEIDDLGLEKTIKGIGEKIEDQLDYPGVIRMMAIRETKVVDYLR